MTEPSNSHPDWTRHVRPRLASLQLNPAREAEIVEELAQHLDLRYDELRRGGASEDEARRLAIEELLEPERATRIDPVVALRNE